MELNEGEYQLRKKVRELLTGSAPKTVAEIEALMN